MLFDVPSFIALLVPENMVPKLLYTRSISGMFKFLYDSKLLILRTDIGSTSPELRTSEFYVQIIHRLSEIASSLEMTESDFMNCFATKFFIWCSLFLKDLNLTVKYTPTVVGSRHCPPR